MRHVLPSRLDERLELSRRLRLGFQKPFDDGAHALQRGERHHHNALRGHCAVQHLRVAISRWFFVAPDDMLGGAFKTRSALLVGLQAQQTGPATAVLDDRTFERPGQTA